MLDLLLGVLQAIEEADAVVIGPRKFVHRSYPKSFNKGNCKDNKGKQSD